MKKYDYSKQIAKIDYSKDIKSWTAWGILVLVLAIVFLILMILYGNEVTVVGTVAGSVSMTWVAVALFLGAHGFKKQEIKHKKEFQDAEDQNNEKWDELMRGIK